MKELERYRDFLAKNGGPALPSGAEWSAADYQRLHRWSVDCKDQFWSGLFSFYDLRFSGSLKPARTHPGFYPYPWFPQVQLNFAENLLAKGEDQKKAVSFVHESGKKRVLTYAELRKEVGALAHFLQEQVGAGEVVAAYMPNIPETLITMLACASLGAVFTSTSCDFGVQGVLDRFGQSLPQVLVAAVGYEYNGKYFDQREKIAQIIEKIPSLKKVILVDFLGKEEGTVTLAKTLTWKEATEGAKKELTFTRLPFSHPLYIMYSSGTTGKPKCMVHTAGGTLLQHVKELGLHSDLRPGRKIFFFTTCGWMMWNWLMSSLFCGAELLLYEGAPSYPSFEHFMKMIDEEKIELFGTSPKFLRALEVAGFKASSTYPTLHTVLSTGAPLLPEQFDFIHQKIKKDVHVMSISGGTDILGCFMLGNGCLKEVRGEIQCLGLGMDVAAYDEQGKAVQGQEGELVCRSPFPSAPKEFLNDASGELYQRAYFEKYPGIWAHGDFVTVTKEGGVLVHGRSDATLNPGGVRIGTGEIYRQTELLPFVDDALCVGKEVEGDVMVILFLKMKGSEKLTAERETEVKKWIRKNTTPRHVPEKIFAVSDIPYTRSGKKMELLIHRMIAGKAMNNLEALANPQCLDEYREILKKI